MADAEQLEFAREWQDPAQWVTTDAAIKKSRFSALTFVENPDSAPKAQWRAKKTADASISLPADLSPLQQRATRRANQSRRSDPIREYFPQLDEITEANGVYLTVAQGKNSYKRGLMVEIWGGSSNSQVRSRHAENARSQIAAWIKSLDGSGGKTERSRKWGKVPSLTPEEKARQRRELDDYIARRAFCQEFSVDEQFTCVSSFEWNSDLGQPNELLGRSYEALDPIRMEYMCYITYKSTTKMFEIHGMNPDLVKKALLRLRGVYFQVSARRLEPRSFYLVEPQRDYSRTRVEFVEDQPPPPGEKAIVRPETLKAHGPLNIMDIEVQPEKIQAKNIDKTLTSVLRCLQGLRYFRGNLTMQIHLGYFVLTQYWADAGIIPRDRFDQMLRDPTMKGQVTEKFPKKLPMQSLEQGKKPPEPLDMVPMNSYKQFEFDDLEWEDGKRYENAYEPVISATLIIKDKDEVLRLDVEYDTDSYANMERTSTRWSRVSTEDGALQKLLDVNMIDVDNISAWELELTVSHIIGEDKMPPLDKYVNENVNVTRNRKLFRDQRSFERLLDIRTHPTLHLQSFRQRKLWRYRLPRSDYVWEMALVRDFKVTKPGTILPMQYEAEDAFWTVDLVSDVWSRLLDHNANLAMGQGVDWKADAATFFPSDSDSPDAAQEGFSQLISRVETFAPSKLASVKWRESFTGGTPNGTSSSDYPI